MKGFFSFLIAAVFLSALLFSASKFTHPQDNSYQQLSSSHLEQIAIKKAFYSSIKEAARITFVKVSAENAAAIAAGSGQIKDVQEEVKKAVHAQALLFQVELIASGYEVAFFCGYTDEMTRQSKSLEISKTKKVDIPPNTNNLILCKDSFLVDAKEMKIQLRNIGFSSYSKSGIGYVAVFPNSYEVKF